MSKNKNKDFEELTKVFYSPAIGMYRYACVVKKHKEQSNPFIQIIRCKKIRGKFVPEFWTNSAHISIPLNHSLNLFKSLEKDGTVPKCITTYYDNYRKKKLKEMKEQENEESGE